MNKHVANVQGGIYDVYVGRPSKWGNPFKVGRDGTREEVVEKYQAWLPFQSHLMDALPELTGKVLGCWCAPFPCHADVLAELAQVAGGYDEI